MPVNPGEVKYVVVGGPGSEGGFNIGGAGRSPGVGGEGGDYPNSNENAEGEGGGGGGY